MVMFVLRSIFTSPQIVDLTSRECCTSKSAYLSHRCFKVDVNFDNAEADSFTLGRATYVRQEDGTFSSGKVDGMSRVNSSQLDSCLDLCIV